MQNPRAKKRSPERGLVSRGHAGSMSSGIMLWHLITTRCVDKGDNFRILTRCDIGATPRRPHRQVPTTTACCQTLASAWRMAVEGESRAGKIATGIATEIPLGFAGG